MKNVRRFVAVAVVIMLAVFALVACAPTPEEAFLKAQENAANLESLDSTIDVSMEMSSMGEKMSLSLTGDMSVFTDPQRMHMNYSVSAQGLTQSIESYTITEGDTIITYTNLLGTWMKSEEPKPTLTDTEANALIQLSQVLPKDFQVTGTEKVNDRDAYRYECVISKEDMQVAMDAMMGMEDFSSLFAGDDPEMLDMLMEGITNADIPVVAYVDVKSLMFVQFEIDMTSLMNSLMQSLMEYVEESEGEAAVIDGSMFDISELKYTVTFKNFNNATDFTIPEEALNAESYEDLLL